MISDTHSRLLSSLAMFKALVMTVRELKFRRVICLAISQVVVPESKAMVSPSLISFAAAPAMRTFSAWCSVCLTWRG